MWSISRPGGPDDGAEPMSDTKTDDRVLPRAAFLTELDETPRAYLLVPSPFRHIFERSLPEIEHMAAQGLKMVEIAARLQIPAAALVDAAARFPDVAAAFTGGRDRGAAEISASLRAAGLAGQRGGGQPAAEDEI